MHALAKTEWWYPIVPVSRTRCLAITELHFPALAEPFNDPRVPFHDAGRIAGSLVAIVVPHANAAIIVLPLTTTLVRLVIADPRVKA